MELVSPIVEIIKSSPIPLMKHVGYLKHFQKNVDDLSEMVKDLEERRSCLENMVSYFLDEQPKNQINRWIGQAIEMEESAKKIEEKAQERKKCFFCPNPMFLYSISKQAKKIADSIAKHHQVGEFEKLTMPSLTPTVIEEAAPSIKGLSSVESTLKNVMAALNDKNNRIIGVWGMGGVGKTTVVKILNNQLVGTRDFSKVIVVVVSKDPDISRIQDDIAGRLGLTLKNGSPRASELSSRLKQEKRFLIILDDLWDGLDLDAVGIPSGDNLKNSKIILTTRKEIVCKKMETQINIVVDVLRVDESWRLFREKAGDVVDDHAIQNTARKVVQECAGLPLAVITVGRALRDCGDPRVWEHALAQLQDSAPDDIEDMEAKVYIPIKLSYEFLRADLKPGFLFCCLYPEDYDIEVDRMLKKWMGEGFLADAGGLEKTINKGHSWVLELKASCLLLQGRGEGFVRMHDVVRDVGISIASKEEGYRSLVKTTTAGLKRLPKGLKWEEYKRVSLMQSKIEELEETASCRQVLTLMLQESMELERIDGFLGGGRMLRVLDLSSTTISKVPKSLSNLDNLRVLCLRSCRLLEWGNLSMLEILRKLESLDLSDNEGLNELPRTTGELRNLRSLDLTRTPNLGVLEKGILPKLRQLEELKMLHSFNRWGSSSMMASLGEVGSLRNLSHFYIEVVDVPDFNVVMNEVKFHVSLNLSRPEDNAQASSINNNLSRHSDRSMNINGDSNGETSLTTLESIMFDKVTGLAFTNCHFSLGFPPANHFQRLKYLSIIKCTGLFYVFRCERPYVSHSNLRFLELHDLPDLRTIYSEELILIWRLKELNVSLCSKLLCLFPLASLEKMRVPTTINVGSCQRMEILFAGEPEYWEHRQHGIVLNTLSTLTLSRLPSMKSIWKAGCVESLSNLTTLSISSCGHLTGGFLSCQGLIGGLPNLVELSVVDCAKVTTIFSEVTENHGLLPNLRKLQLDSLPSLDSIGEGNQTGKATMVWHSLEEIYVRRCSLLKELEPLGRGRKGVPLLEKVEVEEQWWMELEWGGDDSIRLQFQPFFIRQ